ncbi:MAG TPA: hypothetical protein VIN71_09040 [Pseudomonadales bacterium]
MNISPCRAIPACLLLVACTPDTELAGNLSRFDINSYQAMPATDELSGLWITIHQGRRNERIDDIDYDISGHIRETLSISRVDGVYYLRSCLTPGQPQALSVTGDQVTVMINDDVAELTLSGNNRMDGRASHQTASSSYDGSLAMKKVAGPDALLGDFAFYDGTALLGNLPAACFQEAALHVTGKKSLFSQWAAVEMLTVSDRFTDSYRQTAYLVSRDGSADPVRKISFTSASAGSDPWIQAFPSGSETVQLAPSIASVNSFAGRFTIDTQLSGLINIDFPMASTELAPAATSTSAPASEPANDNNDPDWAAFASQWRWDWWNWLLR